MSALCVARRRPFLLIEDGVEDVGGDGWTPFDEDMPAGSGFGGAVADTESAVGEGGVTFADGEGEREIVSEFGVVAAGEHEHGGEAGTAGFTIEKLHIFELEADFLRRAREGGDEGLPFRRIDREVGEFDGAEAAGGGQSEVRDFGRRKAHEGAGDGVCGEGIEARDDEAGMNLGAGTWAEALHAGRTVDDSEVGAEDGGHVGDREIEWFGSGEGWAGWELVEAHFFAAAEAPFHVFDSEADAAVHVRFHDGDGDDEVEVVECAGDEEMLEDDAVGDGGCARGESIEVEERDVTGAGDGGDAGSFEAFERCDTENRAFADGEGGAEVAEEVADRGDHGGVSCDAETWGDAAAGVGFDEHAGVAEGGEGEGAEGVEGGGIGVGAFADEDAGWGRRARHGARGGAGVWGRRARSLRPWCRRGGW